MYSFRASKPGILIFIHLADSNKIDNYSFRRENFQINTEKVCPIGYLIWKNFIGIKNRLIVDSIPLKTA